MKNIYKVLVILILIISPLFACSTIKVLNSEQTITARTMDFFREMNTQIEIVPQGSKYNFGMTKYNFVAITAFGVPAHAVNEKGLSGAMLWLNETKYSQKVDLRKKVISCFEFLQYVIGNCQNIEEVEAFFKDHDVDFVNIPEKLKKLDLLHQHAYFVDAKGNTLILEWIDGKLKQYKNVSPVLVNSPPFEEQKKIWAKQVKDKKDIFNWEYNLISNKMHSSDTRYQLLRRLTEQSLPSSGVDSITKAFKIMNRVSYLKITPYIPGLEEVSWTLYTVVIDHSPDNVKLYYKDDANEAIRTLDFNKLEWQSKKFNIEFGDKFVDLSEKVNKLQTE